jgi:integrase/recombinase XerD
MHPRKDPARRCLKVDLWPERDRRAWQAARCQGDPLEPGGGAAQLAPHSVRKLEKGYGCWLTWLSTVGALDPDAVPAERVTPARVAAYVAHLQTLNAPQTVLTRVQELYQAMTAIVPKRDWTWIRRIEARLRRTVRSTRPKRPRLVPSSRLIRFGMELTRRAERPSGGTPLQRVQFRDGLSIALLAARSLRQRNITAIEIARHLIRRGNGFWLCFGASETKTGEPIEVPVPSELVVPLERYLAVYRPFLARRNGRWHAAEGARPADTALWVSKDGSAMTEIAIHFRIMKLTKAEFGQALSMHLFRDCAATSIATEDPEHVLITKSVLGHSTLRTSERYYNHASSLTAIRLHQARIMELRRAPRPSQKLHRTDGISDTQLFDSSKSTRRR